MRRWCSEAPPTPGLIVLLIAALWAAGMVWPAPAAAHPDLLRQIERLSGELDGDPDNVELLLRRADLYRRHADFRAARRDIDRARRADPAAPRIDFEAGRLALGAGDPATADAALGRYLARTPDHASAWRLRGDARMRLGRYEAAAADYAAAIARAGRPSPALFRLLILARVAAGPERWPAATAAATAALARHPRDPALLGLAVDLALAQQDPAGASAYLESLPAPLLVLPAWRERIAERDCLRTLAAADDRAAAGCTAGPRQRLADAAAG